MNLKLIALSAISILAITGCAANSQPTNSPNQPGSSVVPTSSSSVSQGPTQKPSAEAKAAFKMIAKASCNVAQSTGVVESSGNYSQVMASSAQGYQGFVMAYLQKPNNYGVIEAITGFAACRDWYAFSMADEAGQEAAIDVTLNANDQSFTVAQTGDAGNSLFAYTVKNNLIVTSTNLEDAAAGASNLSYGTLSAEALAILKTAADKQIASQGK